MKNLKFFLLIWYLFAFLSYGIGYALLVDLYTPSLSNGDPI